MIDATPGYQQDSAGSPGFQAGAFQGGPEIVGDVGVVLGADAPMAFIAYAPVHHLEADARLVLAAVAEWSGPRAPVVGGGRRRRARRYHLDGDARLVLAADGAMAFTDAIARDDDDVLALVMASGSPAPVYARSRLHAHRAALDLAQLLDATEADDRRVAVERAVRGAWRSRVPGHLIALVAEEDDRLTGSGSGRRRAVSLSAPRGAGHRAAPGGAKSAGGRAIVRDARAGVRGHDGPGSGECDSLPGPSVSQAARMSP